MIFVPVIDVHDESTFVSMLHANPPVRFLSFCLKRTVPLLQNFYIKIYLVLFIITLIDIMGVFGRGENHFPEK